MRSRSWTNTSRSRHHDVEPAGCQEGAAQRPGVGERDLLLDRAAAPDRPGIDPAMARVDGDDALARHAARRRRGGGPRRRGRRLRGRAAQRGEEGIAPGRLEVDDDPVLVARSRRQGERFGDRHRPVEVEHDARRARAEQPVAHAGDRPARRLGAGRQAPFDLGQVDHGAVGVGQQEQLVGGRLGQFEDEAGGVAVRPDSHRGHGGRIARCGPGGFRRDVQPRRQEDGGEAPANLPHLVDGEPPSARYIHGLCVAATSKRPAPAPQGGFPD
jgi:hypothetical protein